MVKKAMSGATTFRSIELLDSRIYWRMFYAALAIALISVGITVFGREFSHSLAVGDFSSSTEIRRIEIGKTTLLVPENAIRFNAQRKDGREEKLDLFLKWPEMSGYTPALRDNFILTSKDPALLFLSFSEQVMSRDMSGRFDPIYHSLIVQPGAPGPAGLAVYRFREETGFRGETLVTGDDGNGRLFVARCMEKSNLLTACERDIIAGPSLSVTYRFSWQLLPQWRAIDSAVSAYARKLVVPHP